MPSVFGRSIVPNFSIDQSAIYLTGDGRYDEAIAGANAPSPGHLLQLDSDGTVQVHGTYGGLAERIFAIEDSLQGGTIQDAYTTGNVVRYVFANPGDVVFAIVPAFAAPIKCSNLLISNGDGTLVLAQPATAEVLFDSVTASGNVTNTTAPTLFNQNFTIPANTLRAGDVLKIRGEIIAPTTNGTDTLQLNLLIGSTVIAATAAVDVANNDEGYFEAQIVIRTIGASGTFVAAGVQSLGTSVAAKPFQLGSTAIDTTAAQTIAIQATWSVASAGDVARQDVLSIELRRNFQSKPIAVAIDNVNNSANSTPAFCTSRVL